MSAKKMLAAAREDLGLSGRPNRISRSYSKRNGEEFLRAPWCDQAVTEWARRSGNEGAVLPEGDRAYTVWHAEDGKDLGRWHKGTVANLKAHAEPGAVIFFDWGGTNDIARVDHVGIIERVLADGRVQTIEANTGDAVKRRIRSSSVIAGFWNPEYAPEDAPAPTVVVKDGVPQWPGRVLKVKEPMQRGDDVKTWQAKLAKRGWNIDVDGWYGPQSRGVCRGFQRATGLPVTGKVDKDTWEMTWSWRPPAPEK